MNCRLLIASYLGGGGSGECRAKKRKKGSKEANIFIREMEEEVC